MAIELGVAYISVLPSTSRLAPELNKSLGAVEKSVGQKQGAGIGSKLASGMGKALKVGAVASGAAVAGVLGKSLVSGFKRLNAIDQAEAKLRGLGHSAKSVTGIMGNALASVKGTAFGLDEAATTAGAVVAAGIKPGKQLEGVLKTVADTATIAGTSMSDMGAIFGSVAARGKLQGDDLLQLQSKGVPVLAFLAKHYGITSKAASDMVTKGQVDFKNFAAAMHENIGGAALDSGKTVQGAWKNLWASVSRIGANVLSGVFPKLQGAFTGLTKFLGPVEDRAKGFGQKVGSGIKIATDAVKTFVNAFRGKGDVGGKWMVPMVEAGVKARAVFDRLKTAVSGAFDYISNKVLPVVVSGFKGLWDAAKPIGPAMVTIGKALLPIFQGGGKSAKDSGPGILATAFSLLRLAVKGLAAILTGVANFAENHGTAFRRMAVGVVAAVVAYKALSAAMRVQQALAAAGGILKYLKNIKLVQAATKVWSVIQWALNAALNANPISLIIIGLVALGAGLVLAYKKSETFRRIVNGAWAGVKAAAVAVFHWFTGTFVPFFTKTIPGVFSGLVSFIRSHWKAILVGILAGPVGLAVLAIGKHFDKLKTVAFSAIRWVVGKFLWFAQQILDATAKAFSLIPGLGGKLRKAADDFAKFRDRVNRSLGGIRNQNVDIVTRYRIKGPSANQQAAKLGDIMAARGMAGGGTVFGARAPYGDKVLTPLAPGEEVISNRHGQADAYRPLLKAINAGRGLADGGTVFNVRAKGLGVARSKFESLAEDVSSVTSRLAASLKSKLQGVVDRFAVLGGPAASGPHISGGYRLLEQMVAAHVRGAIVTSDLRPGARTIYGTPSMHGLGRAVDWGGNMRGVWNFLYPLRGRLHELLGPWGMFRDGAVYRDPTLQAMHENHVHASTFDQGGILPPGLTLAYNGTGKNERILTHEQSTASQFPKKLTLVVGGREFDAYLSDRADARISRAGQRSATRV